MRLQKKERGLAPEGTRPRGELWENLGKLHNFCTNCAFRLINRQSCEGKYRKFTPLHGGVTGVW
ncbi:hypothetical protein RKLH11_2243 [Rhodobacteraceae bacterium KLH11]|nr:hypothetical protein RKLH11_2243 [Rhodobacteraceae bacterium KLH11]